MNAKKINIRGATLALIVLCAGLTACTKAKPNESGSESANAKRSVVVTLFPVYDWVKEIVGEKKQDVQLTLLFENGVDLHSFQPTVQDIVHIQKADLFIYIGGESDKWVADVLKTTERKQLVALNLLEALGDRKKEETIIEGMEEEPDEEEEESEYDEHVWLSLTNADILSCAICNALCALDRENAETYRKNQDIYSKKLSALNAEYEAMVTAAPRSTVLFGDRFPFRYLCDDYGLSYYAAFPGCSAETEASFKTIVFLSQTLDSLSLPAICILETNNGKIAQTIRDNAKTSHGKSAQILTLNSMQSIQSRDRENGAQYLQIMQENLAVLTKALQ